MADLAFLDNAVIVAADGQMLGLISRDPFSPDSIANPFGTYGSRYSAASIFNPYGTYGSEFMFLSPWNRYTTTPPRIMVHSHFHAYLTVNPYLRPRIHPSVLAAEFISR